MELIFAIGRYFDGQNVFSKPYITIALGILFTAFNLPELSYEGLIKYFFQLLAIFGTMHLGIGKFNSAFTGTGYNYKDRTLYFLDIIADFFAYHINDRIGGVIGMSLRYFIPAAPLLYWSNASYLLLLAGLFAWGYGILESRFKKDGNKCWSAFEFSCGYLVGAALWTKTV